MNETEKRMNDAVDMVTSLDQRIAQQVEHQVEQRLTQEREHLRCVIIDERKLVAKLITELVQTAFTELVQTSHNKMIRRVEQLLERIEARAGRSDGSFQRRCAAFEALEGALE